MYVCLCNGLTDRAIRSAAEGGADRVKDIYRRCACQAQCGRCAATVLSLLREARAEQRKAA